MNSKPKDERSTSLYAKLYADFEAQCDTLYEIGDAATQANVDVELEEIKEEFRKDPRYAILVKHDFQPPTNHTRRAVQSDLDKIVETHGL